MHYLLLHPEATFVRVLIFLRDLFAFRPSVWIYKASYDGSAGHDSEDGPNKQCSSVNPLSTSRTWKAYTDSQDFNQKMFRRTKNKVIE